MPHMGWNEVDPGGTPPLFEGFPERPTSTSCTATISCRGQPDVAGDDPVRGRLLSAVANDRVFGVQFHPEKSQRAGFTVLRQLPGRSGPPC